MTLTNAFPWRISAARNGFIHLQITAAGSAMISNFLNQDMPLLLKNNRKGKTFSIGRTPFPVETAPGRIQRGKEARNRPG